MEGTFKPPFILHKDKYRLPMLTTAEYIEEFQEMEVIYLYRHPKDVICSFHNFHLKLYKRFGGADVLDTPEQFDTFFHAVLAGDIEYGSWFDHVLEYYPHRDKDFFLFISYEDMKQDITSVIERVSAFLGRHVDGDTIKRIIGGASFPTMKKAFEEDHHKHLVEGSGKMPLDVFSNKAVVSEQLKKSPCLSECLPVRSPVLFVTYAGDVHHIQTVDATVRGTTAQWKTRFTSAQNAEFDKIFCRRVKD